MHRDVGRIGHQPTSPIEEGAGEIEPLADVHRTAALLQPHPHLLGDGGEAVVVELQPHRIERSGLAGLAAGRVGAGIDFGFQGIWSRKRPAAASRSDPGPSMTILGRSGALGDPPSGPRHPLGQRLQQQRPIGQHLAAPTRLQHGGARGFEHHGGPHQPLAPTQLLAAPTGHLAPSQIARQAWDGIGSRQADGHPAAGLRWGRSSLNAPIEIRHRGLAAGAQ